MDLVKGNPPDGALERGLSLGRLGLSLTGSYLGYQFQRLLGGAGDPEGRRERFERDASRQVRERLQTLKGPVMKLGQMLSMQGAFLTPVALEELTALQMRAPPMHPTLARAQFKASLGRDPEDCFAEFDPVPVAAASLGQVHRARSRAGEPLAVKIQYPAIHAAVRNDFKLLRSAFVVGRLSGHIPAGLLTELEARIVEETDYLKEARNLETFQVALRPLPFVQLPRVFREWSTERVLTMTFVEGLPLDRWLENRPSPKVRNLVGERLFELFYFQMFRAGALHADPHPGNYLLSPEGEVRLVDFGCVKEVQSTIRAAYGGFLDAMARPGVGDMSRLAGLLWGQEKGRRDGEAEKLLREVLVFAREVFQDGRDREGRVDFGRPEVFRAMRRFAESILRSKLIIPEMAFYKRAEIGMLSYLHQLGARVRALEIVDRVREGSTAAKRA